jgi:putative ABC transport system ATP-binding protein
MIQTATETPKLVPLASATMIAVRDLTKVHQRGDERLVVFEGIELEIKKGSFVALMGPSGSGKSTLLNLIAGLDRPSRGTIEVGGARIDRLAEKELAAWRAKSVGIVFQSYNLMPVLSAVENVALPLLLSRHDRAERLRRAHTALRIVGLADRAEHTPRQLSGGQQQRVAIARAIVHDPALIVADEPTGDLDRKSADDILSLFELLHRELGKTIVMVTHDPSAADRAQTQRHLDKGVLT